MKKLLALIALPAMLLALGSCSKKSSTTPSTDARVMFVHACASGTGTINLAAYYNGAAVANAGNLAFLANSGYQNLKAGTGIQLSFGVTGLGGLDTGMVTLSTDSSYSAFAGGSVTHPVFVFTSDNLAAPAAGYAKVRFVNLSFDNITAVCNVGLTALDSTLAPMAASPFYQVQATGATTKIEMYDAAHPVNSAAISAQTLTAGKIYTFMLTGTSTVTSGSSVLTLTALNNN